MRYIYLHGFASSPRSRKAQTFRRAVASHGIHLEIPALDAENFSLLTLSGQLRILDETVTGSPCRLIGSSMGGYLAALYAAAHPEVERLVLMAPAFGFEQRWRQMQGPETIAQWRETGWLPVFHYGEQAMRHVHYGLLEDAAHYPGFPDFTQPALIFHGTGDTVVPIDLSRTFAAAHPNALLVEMDSGHELLNVLDDITHASTSFLTE